MGFGGINDDYNDFDDVKAKESFLYNLNQGVDQRKYLK